MKRIHNRILVLILCPAFILSGLYPACAQEATTTGSAAGAGQTAAQVNSLRDFLSSSGIIIPNQESNSITIVDYPSNLDRIQEYLNMVDVKPQQVLIEAKVVEVTLTKEHSLGVNWSLFAKSGGWDIGGGATVGSAAGDALLQQLPYRNINWEPISGTEQDPFTIGIFNDNINVVLKALTTQMQTNILSAPKITTVNNLRAKINVVKTVPYLKDVEESEESTSGGTTTTRYTYTYDYADEGVVLEATPQVNPDGTITLMLYPQVKEIVAWHEMPAPAGATKAPELPETDVRTAQTKVNIKNGQTIVLGGLIRAKVRSGSTKVPGAGDLPIIGKLFGDKVGSTDKTELLIFVSPTVITSNEIAHMQIQDKYGLGRDGTREREKLEAEMYSAQAQETAKRNTLLEKAMKKTQQNLDLASYLTDLEEKQKALSLEGKKLEAKIQSQEKKVSSLKETEKKTVKERKRLEGAQDK
ncbi:MAG: hypothetical protein PHJ00_01810 [Candidatus Omnitrophica bacterium]|nr:hypothetical protein [Candidatus Omnitrophota bacterium]MDD5654360.1 hypothetical protein [Candidatus Omnitrophota bacterium]